MSLSGALLSIVCVCEQALARVGYRVRDRTDLVGDVTGIYVDPRNPFRYAASTPIP